ncbi:MAG: hypothetical protein Q4B69_02325 [Slackia sp.]|nr:hypothetical protein [Slackia sp.]
MRRHTQKDFADAFVELVERTQKCNISVVDLAKETGFSRKTFYRNFDDIDDLVIWNFRDSMRRIVEERFEEAVWVRPHPDLNDKYASWPFYARIVNEEGELDQGKYFEQAAAHFERHPCYYRIVFRQKSGGYHDFQQYLRRLFTYAIGEDIVAMAKGRAIDPRHVKFLAEYHAAGIAGRLEQFICERGAVMSEESAPHWNYSHMCIKRDLETYYFSCPEALRRG